MVSGGRVNLVSALGLVVRAARAPREVHPTLYVSCVGRIVVGPLSKRGSRLSPFELTQSSAEAAEAVCAAKAWDALEAEAPMRELTTPFQCHPRAVAGPRRASLQRRP